MNAKNEKRIEVHFTSGAERESGFERMRVWTHTRKTRGFRYTGGGNETIAYFYVTDEEEFRALLAHWRAADILFQAFVPYA